MAGRTHKTVIGDFSIQSELNIEAGEGKRYRL